MGHVKDLPIAESYTFLYCMLYEVITRKNSEMKESEVKE